MTLKCSQIISHIETLAPLDLCEEWDNCGLAAGDPDREIDRVLVALDVTEDVVDEAVKSKAGLIVSHHPLLFNPLRNICTYLPHGRLIQKILASDLCVYSAHTNLDRCKGGVNDTLAEKMGLTDIQVLFPSQKDEAVGLGRIGVLKVPMKLVNLVEKVKQDLQVSHLRMIGSVKGPIPKIAVVGGAYPGGAGEIKETGAQVLVAGDIKYHDALDILANGLCAIDAGHFATERVIIPVLAQYIRKLGVEVLEAGEQDRYRVM